MNDREKLIEIVRNSLKKNIGKSCKLAENIVDDIIGAGVIVPPVQVGATVYYTDSYRHLIKPLEIFGFDCTKRICKYYCSGEDYTPAWFNPAEIGKTVFLTREEAEKALRESEENA